jgi:hypothetical protein
MNDDLKDITDDIGTEIEPGLALSTEHEEVLLQEITEADDTIAELRAELVKYKSYVTGLQKALHEFLAARESRGIPDEQNSPT